MDQVSVLLASSRAALQLSLQKVLENEGWIKVVGTPASEADTLHLARTLGPQVVIIDFDRAEDSVEAGRLILEMSPGVKIILLGPHDYISSVAGKQKSQEAAVADRSIEGFSNDSSPAELMQSIATIKRQRRIQ